MTIPPDIMALLWAAEIHRPRVLPRIDCSMNSLYSPRPGPCYGDDCSAAIAFERRARTVPDGFSATVERFRPSEKAWYHTAAVSRQRDELLARTSLGKIPSNWGVEVYADAFSH